MAVNIQEISNFNTEVAIPTIVSNFETALRLNIISTENRSVFIRASTSPCGFIVHTAEIPVDSDIELILVTSKEEVSAVSKFPMDQQLALNEAKVEEIKFLIGVPISSVPQTIMDGSSELQSVKWTLIIKSSPTAPHPVQYRARLVSAAHLPLFAITLQAMPRLLV